MKPTTSSSANKNTQHAKSLENANSEKNKYIVIRSRFCREKIFRGKKKEQTAQWWPCGSCRRPLWWRPLVSRAVTSWPPLPLRWRWRGQLGMGILLGIWRIKISQDLQSRRILIFLIGGWNFWIFEVSKRLQSQGVKFELQLSYGCASKKRVGYQRILLVSSGQHRMITQRRRPRDFWCFCCNPWGCVDPETRSLLGLSNIMI